MLFFAVWAGAFLFGCLGGGPFYVLLLAFLSVRAGTGVHSLTGLPISALRGLTTKKTKQPPQKKDTGSKNQPLLPHPATERYITRRYRAIHS